MNDVVEFKRSRPNVQYRYLVMPSGKVASGLRMIDFNPSNTKPMIELGKKDAAKILGLGEGFMFSMLDAYFELDQETRDRLSFQHFMMM